MTTYTTIEYKSFQINIEYDEDPPNPLGMGDPLGTMLFWHPRYDLGHKHNYNTPTDFLRDIAGTADTHLDDKIDYWENGPGWSRLAGKPNDVDIANANIDKLITAALEKHYIMLPIYLYDHSGITIRTAPFTSPWDSGQVGYIFVSKRKIQAEYGFKKFSKKRVIQIENYLNNEIKEYDTYLTGRVFGYTITPLKDTSPIECEDSCWGFFGDEGIDQATADAKEAIDYCIKDHRAQTRKRIEEKKTNR